MKNYMRQDRIFKIRVRKLISEILKDVRASEKGVFRYFNPSFKNKRLFEYNSTWADSRPGHANSLFGRDQKASMRWDNFTEVMFSQMMREAKLRRAYLLLPNKEGEFRSSQKKILARFTDLILRRMSERENELNRDEVTHAKNETGKSKTRAEIEEIIAKSQENLGKHNGLNTISALKYNEETGLIEGSVLNTKDVNKEALKVEIDPENENLILFSSTTLGIYFVMENNDKDLSLFDNKGTQEMLDAGEVATEKFDNTKQPLSYQEEGFTLKNLREESGINEIPVEEIEVEKNGNIEGEIDANSFNKNPSFEAMLKGQISIPHSIKRIGNEESNKQRGEISSSPTNRVESEKALQKQEEEKAIANHLPQKQQDQLKQEDQEQQDKEQRKKRMGGQILGASKWIKWVLASAVGFNFFT